MGWPLPTDSTPTHSETAEGAPSWAPTWSTSQRSHRRTGTGGPTPAHTRRAMLNATAPLVHRAVRLIEEYGIRASDEARGTRGEPPIRTQREAAAEERAKRERELARTRRIDQMFMAAATRTRQQDDPNSQPGAQATPTATASRAVQPAARPTVSGRRHRGLAGGRTLTQMWTSPPTPAPSHDLTAEEEAVLVDAEPVP